MNSILVPGAFPTRCIVEGTLAEIQANVPQTELAEGYASTGERLHWYKGAWHFAGGVAPVAITAANYGALPAPAVGQQAWLPRLDGHGRFWLSADPLNNRWEVMPGQSVISDSGGAGSPGYDLTSVGGGYNQLVAYSIPVGMIGDGESWEADIFGIATVTPFGSNSPQVRIAGVQLVSNLSSNNAPRITRNRGATVRIGSKLIINSAVASDIYQEAGVADITPSFAAPIIVDAVYFNGGAGVVCTVRYWAFRRIA